MDIVSIKHAIPTFPFFCFLELVVLFERVLGFRMFGFDDVSPPVSLVTGRHHSDSDATERHLPSSNTFKKDQEGNISYHPKYREKAAFLDAAELDEASLDVRWYGHLFFFSLFLDEGIHHHTRREYES